MAFSPASGGFTILIVEGGLGMGFKMLLSKCGAALSFVYLLLLINPIRYVFFDPGNAPYDILGSKFGLFVFTMPGSLSVDFFKNFARPDNYIARDRIELAVCLLSGLANIVIVYFSGWGAARIYQKLARVR